MKTAIPAGAKPIVDFEDSFSHATGVIWENAIPLCPHCGEWSYYTTDEANERGGYTVCPFCGGAMFLKDSFSGNVGKE